jgi:hypothetical protein
MKNDSRIANLFIAIEQSYIDYKKGNISKADFDARLDFFSGHLNQLGVPMIKRRG